MTSKLHTLCPKEAEASKFLSKHVNTRYKETLEKNKKYIHDPPTIEKLEVKLYPSKSYYLLVKANAILISAISYVLFGPDETSIFSLGIDGKVTEWSLQNQGKILWSRNCNRFCNPEKSQYYRDEIDLDTNGKRLLVTSNSVRSPIYHVNRGMLKVEIEIGKEKEIETDVQIGRGIEAERTENERDREKSRDRVAKDINREKSREREVKVGDRERIRVREVKERVREKSRDREVKERVREKSRNRKVRDKGVTPRQGGNARRKQE
ncbi:WD repeat-containing protein 91 homolog isoform X1 [Tanacetum coccineum]